MIAQNEPEWEISTVTARLKSDEVSLCVADGKGWNIMFDREPLEVMSDHT